MKSGSLSGLEALGQSVWLDYICRDILEDGSLTRLIEDDGISGVTSNPAIFEQAIASGVYGEAIAGCHRAGLAPASIYRNITIRDVGHAADLLLGVYEATDRLDGYVSLEVPPALADDTAATCVEAHRLWSLVNRPNLMIKVPATAAGLPAVSTLIGEGINVNVTLLFSRRVYRDVAQAFMRGMELWIEHGGDPGAVASVASFFVSRIDTAVDKLLDSSDDSRASALKGKIAIASARLAYQDYLAIKDTERWQALGRAGARPQRLLWGSTSTKNPVYRDVLYVESLIGPETVNTVPMTTLDAFRDHGKVHAGLVEAVDEAELALGALSESGISLDAVTSELTREGIRLFSQANDRILAALA